MRTVPIICVLALALPLAGRAAEVERGDTYLEVRQALGEPRGQLQVGERQKLLYDRGEVVLEGGVVTKVLLRSETAQREWEARRAAEAELFRAEHLARQARLSEEGTALKERKLADPNFRSAPAAYQLAFWEDFARLYPDVPCAEELAIARWKVAEQDEEKRSRVEESRRIAELELRVREAEARAAEAEEAARASRYPVGYYGYYGGRVRKPFTLGPFEYRFGENPQPPYVTPSGNPAGRMDGAPYVTPSGNPAGSMSGAPYATPSVHAPAPHREGRDRRGP